MNNTAPIADVIIIGSGPAGVSAAWPLLKAGVSVLMLDRGKTSDISPRETDPPSLHQIRTGDQGQWKRFLGTDFSALRPRGLVSPKLKVPDQQFVFDGFRKAYGVQTDHFQAVGSLARGGLSNAWGAGAYVYDEVDLKGFPLARADIAASARAVAERIGISGSAADDMAAFYGADIPLQPALDLDPRAARLLRAYERKKQKLTAAGFRLGRARNAVLSEALGPRGACAYDDMCLWGCERGAVYNAAQELGPLRRQPLFRYQPGVFVTAIARENGMYRIALRTDDGDAPELRCKTLVLAAGTLGSTALALRHLGFVDREVPLYSNPTIALPLVVPSFLGTGLARRNFALGQLGFRLHLSGPDGAYAHGVVFAASGLPASDFLHHIPLSRPAAIRLFRALQPALLIANCFLPGDMSRNRIRVTDGPDGHGLNITGGYADDCAAAFRSATRAMASSFRKLGALAIPGGARTSEPGADIHYAGTLPMRSDDAAPSAVPSTSPFGELAGCAGLYVVDGAVLNQVTAKNPTFTIMANADRIARHIAEKLKA